MSKNSSGTKIMGKLFAVLTLILLAAAAAMSWYISGQNRAVEKYCAAVASGSYKDFEKTAVTAELDALGISAENFKNASRAYFEGLPEFSELGETDIINSKVRINEHTMETSFSQWICTADIDFYCSGMSVSYPAKFRLSFANGKWIVTDSAI